MDGINKLAEGIGKAVEAVPDIYKDGMQPATKESGKTLALIPQTINAALAPLRQWIAQKEYNVAETEKLLAMKLEKVGEENIVSPESYIAVPAIQAISYCMNSEELRNMYANLLAASMTADKKWDVHPSFVELIKQISPDEAKLLRKVSEKTDSFPLIDVRIQTPSGGYITRLHNFTSIAEGVCDRPENVFSYLDNLERLKIIDIPNMVRIDNDEVYKPLEEHIEIQNEMSKPLPDGYSWKIERRKFEITQYGKQFIQTCISDIS